MKRKLLNQIQLLMIEGNKFTFQNFCYPHAPEGKYGGKDTPRWLIWKTRSFNLITKLSASNSPAVTLAEEAMEIHTEGFYPNNFERQKETMLEALKLTAESVKNDPFEELKKPTSKKTFTTLSSKIFVVHGHDHSLKTEVENFLINIGLEPIVLHKKPDEGQTIIEKFEKHSDVGYAFILLTPDDIAYTIDQDAIEDSKRTKQKQSRPNVILEFGYFVGKLGRNRVCCIYKEGVALPSDLSGLLYKKIEKSIEEKGYEIIKELQAAGYKLQIK
ncbi:MAG: nucleotide-binding protein [Candidatus Omnitrophica bacterium]|nr:nucleotide-binding protein [Candidatus Omnitrophota bacterium]